MSIKFLKKKKFSRVVIFGSSGIISSNLQSYLKKKKIPIKVIKSSYIDLRDKKKVKKIKRILKKDDSIVFISAEAPVKNFEMLENSLKMSINFCETIDSKSIEHLIYISSDAVYKDIKKPMSEISKTEPNSLHGYMHLVREIIFKKYFKNKLLILRPTLIYGVEDNHQGYGPNLFLTKSLEAKSIKIFGNGEERRDHVYIDDLIKILTDCLEKKIIGIINIASGQINSFYNIASFIQKLTKTKKKIIKLKRKGPMPHNGYRAFNINNLKRNFKNIKITLIQEGLLKYYLKKKYEN